jgi:hypothetical protein
MSNWERRPLSAAQLQYAALDASCAHPLLSALAALVPDWRSDAVTLGTPPPPPPPPPPPAARSTPAEPEAATRALGPEDVTAALAELLRADGAAGGEAQAQAEAAVLELRAQGHTSAEAAAALGVSADRIVKSIGVICGGGSGSAVSE